MIALLTAIAGIYMSSTPGVNLRTGLMPLGEVERETSERVRAHVLAISRDIGLRGAQRPVNTARAEEYIELELKRIGLTWQQMNFDTKNGVGRNFEVLIPGARNPKEIVIVGAHTDSARGSPGANGNASGCAVLIELARNLAGTATGRQVKLLFFGDGEEPYTASVRAGSHHYVQQALQRKDNIVAMLSVDAVGRYDTNPGSQSVTFPFNFFYPDTGDFLAFVGNLSSRSLVRNCVQTFRGATTLPAEGGAFPTWLPSASNSNHAAFWENGIDAVWVTDTASLRSDEHATGGDLHDRLDYDRMARVVTGLTKVVAALANSSGTLQ
ncbi:MAG: M28 family peptidase [Planctomycetota bacterium]